MQLKDKRRVLSAATLTLLGGAALPAAHAESADIDTAMLVYSESGGRVQAVEPVIEWTQPLSGQRFFTGKLVLDALSGATPTGATPSSTPQTVSSPSGGGSTTVTAAGDTPLDHSFKDTRAQGVANYSLPVFDSGTLSGGLNASTEYDFLSMGGNLRFSYDLFQHNTTLSTGVNFESDQVNPVGGVPVPLSTKSTATSSGETEGEGASNNNASSANKTVTDLMAGVTQVLSPKSLVQFNYSLSMGSGYQNDPYKILSVVGSDGEPTSYVYEARPDKRTKQALYGQYKRFVFDRDVANLSYRFMHDDWGITSHTVDFSYRRYLGAHFYLQPHVRWYTQNAADFYRVALYTGEQNQVQYASADPRLSAFNAWTVGLGTGSMMRDGTGWSARLELYQQNQKLTNVPAQAAQGLSKFNLTPGLTAVTFTVGYHFKW